MDSKLNLPGPFLQLLLLLSLFALTAACSEPPAPTPPPSAEAPTQAPQTPQAPVAEAAEPDEAADILLADLALPHAVVEEAFISVSTPEHNVDSPTLWLAPDGSTWLYASAKDTDLLLVYDGDSGVLKGTAGAPGEGPGQLRRPNGVYAIDNLLLVVERDNHRVQVFSLPALQSLGSFGEDSLKKPYGLWVRSHLGGYEVIVSDAYMSAANENQVPALADLGQRYRRFQISVVEGALQAQETGVMGAIDAAGAIRIAESLWGDYVQNRLLLAEEDQTAGTRIKVYDMTGAYTGEDIGTDLFKVQAEGIALYDCADGSGYWIATDQFKDRSLFHVFDRQTLQHRGSFAGATTANTDGIWLHQAPGKVFPDGVLYAVHDDQAVAAFDWRAIAAAIGVRASCSS
jgi:3-phytase